MFEDKDGKLTLKDIWNDEKSSDKGKFPPHTWVKHLEDPFRPKSPGDGHSVLAVGYDDATKLILVQNSRGSDWGNHGYFYMPYAWISDFAATNDFWTIRSIEENPYRAPVRWEQIHKEVVGRILAGGRA